MAALLVVVIAAPGQDFLSIAPGKLGLPGYDSFMVLLSGMDKGFLEQGGCNPEQKGGLEPKAHLVQRLSGQLLPTLLLDLGDSLPDPSPRAEAVAATILRTMDGCGYNGMLLSGNELLSLPPAFMERMAGAVHFPFLGANLTQGARPPRTPYWKPWTKVQLGNLTVGVIGLVPESLPLDASGFYRIAGREETLVRLLPEVRRQVDKIAVLTPDVDRLPLDRFPEVDLWIGHNPRMAYAYTAARRPMVYHVLGTDYLSAFILRYPQQRGRVILVPANYPLFTQRYPDPAARSGVAALYRELATTGRAPQVDGVLLGQPEESRPGAAYVGSASCAGCHPEAYAQWKGTAHAHATVTLASRERDFWPECLACHSTGYGGTTRVGRGFLPEVGCETCHGPGAQHAAAPARGNIRNDVTPTTAEVCEACHAPPFDFTFPQQILQRFADIVHTSSKLSPGRP